MPSAAPRLQAIRLPVGGSWRGPIVAAATVICVGSTTAAAVLGQHHRSALAFLVAAQAAGVVLLAGISWDDGRQWATAGVITAAAWTLTFLIPSALYLADPALLDVTSTPVETFAIVNLGLFGLIAGVAFVQVGRPKGPTRRPARAVELGYSQRWLAFWLGLGVLGFALVFHGAGGLIDYVSNLDEQGRINQGRTYFVWMALFARYALQILVYHRWANARNAGLRLSLLVTVVIAVTGLLGARLFVAMALAEIALFHAWTRGPIPLRRIVPVVAVIGVGVILLGGAVKRYQGSGGSDEAFAHYLVRTAPGEVSAAYANNYADGVRLIALAHATIPDHGGYEHGQVLLRYALQPLPSAIRPESHRPAALRRALYPGGGYVYAIPLHVIAYLQGGPVVVLFVFGLLGAAIRLLDRAAWRLGEASFTRIVVLTSAAVAVPSYLRAAEAGGASVAALDTIGLALVAVTVIDGRLRTQLAGTAAARAG